MSTAFNELKNNTRSWFQLYINLGLRILLTPLTLGTLTVITTFGTGYDKAIAETPNVKQATTQSEIKGTWELTPKKPNVSNVSPMPTLKVIITPEGKIFIQNLTDQNEYTEVGVIKKSSETTSLPPNAKIIDPYSLSNKGRQAEAKAYVSTLNKVQQAHFLEKNAWGKSLKDLEIGIKPETENYRYSVKIDNTITTVKTNPYPGIAINMGIAKKANLKSYIGFVSLNVFLPNLNEFTTLSVLCESNKPTMEAPPLPKWDGKELKCPNGYISLGL